MPYILDFDKKIDKIYTMKLSPFGWVDNPIEVEYCTKLINCRDPQPSVCMRVKGTEHVWANFLPNINFESKGDYAKYFTEILEGFRLDMLTWIHTPAYQNLPWVKEYWKMFQGRFYDFSKKEQQQFDDIAEKGFSSMQDKQDSSK